jgi:hypothetical protein
MANPDICIHNYDPFGLQWWNDNQPRPGSGATTIRYVHAFYCTKCLATVVKPAEIEHDSYTKTLTGASPVSSDDARKLRSSRGTR